MDQQSKTTLILIRHGETHWNRQERFQGHGDSCLTELGRARETAGEIAALTGHQPQTDSRLRERD